MAKSKDTSAYWRKLLRLDEELPKDFTKNLDSFWKVFRKPLHRAFERLGQRDYALTAVGLENLPGKPPFIIASNHASSMDFPAIFICLPEKYRREVVVMYTGFFDKLLPAKWAIKAFVSSFSVDLDGNFWEALAKSAKVLKCKKIIYIAPEGKRSYDGKLLPFKVGAGALAVEADVPVVPVYIKGTFETLPRGKFIPKKHPIRVVFGKPIYPDSFIEKKKNAAAYGIYKEFTEKLREEINRLSLI
ncbi:MAG: lysophospholipid acyltransferase family protein [Candidatus Margulisiibacteriota bacterium]